MKVLSKLVAGIACAGTFIAITGCSTDHASQARTHYYDTRYASNTNGPPELVPFPSTANETRFPNLVPPPAGDDDGPDRPL